MKHLNPSNMKVKIVKESTSKQIKESLTNARISNKSWVNVPLYSRIKYIQRIRSHLKQNKITIAKAITSDMGKPLDLSIAEVEYSIVKLNYFLKIAHILKGKKITRKDSIVYKPLGTVGIITPWNYPISTAMSSLIPALLAGNVVIVKPSEYTPSMVNVFKKMAKDVYDKSIPKNVLNVLCGGGKVGRELISSDIDMISFTGSIKTGKDIQKHTNKRLPKLLLEMGGLDGAIVLKDADLTRTAKKIILKNSTNSGQICNAIKRVFVEKEIYEKFIQLCTKFSKELKIGNPYSNVDMGPVANIEQITKIETFLSDVKKKGGKILSGGKRLKDKGLFFPHTVVANANQQMKIMQEELFGPVLPIQKIESVKEGIKLINDTRYALSGSVWTKNMREGLKIAEQIVAGSVCINSHGETNLNIPWGGLKESGINKLYSKNGLLLFTNEIHIRKSKL